MRVNGLVGVLLTCCLGACSDGDAPSASGDVPRSKAENVRRSMAAQPSKKELASPEMEMRSEELLDFAETSPYGVDLLWPHESTRSWGPFRYRYYWRKRVHVGVVVEPDAQYTTQGDVYVMGGPYGAQPVRVGRLDDFIGAPMEPPTNPLLAINPPTWTLNASEGESAHLYVGVTPTFQFQGKLYLRFDDPDRRWSSQTVSVDPGKSALTSWGSSTSVPRGVHQGAVQVRLCATSDCASEYPGSPVQIPYRLGVVRAMPNLTFPWNNKIIAAWSPTAEASVEVAVSARVWPSEPLYFRADDQQGRVAGLGSLLPGDGSERKVRFPVVMSAGPGRYSGRFLIRACWDPACAEVVATSSWQAYELAREANNLVDSSVNATPQLTPLSSLLGAPDWTNSRGNPGNAGYVPVRLDASKFSLRWRWDLPAGKDYWLLQPAMAGGKVALAAAGSYGNAHTELFVLREADGSLVWRKAGAFGSGTYFGAPIVSEARLYSLVGTFPSQLQAFDLTTGQQQFSTNVSRESRNAPPILVGNSVVLPYGAAGGVISIDSSSGRILWQNHANAVSGIGGMGLASDGAMVFSYGLRQGVVAAYALATGEAQFAIPDDQLRGFIGGGPTGQVLSAHQGRAFLVEGGALVAFDLAAKRTLWRQVTGDYTGGVAAQGDVVIALRNGPLRVEARRSQDGSLLWSSKPQFDLANTFLEAFESDPILTDNLVFVSTQRGVFALDRSTGNPLWFYGKSGKIAISSNGILTIVNGRLSAGRGAGVTAINLH